MVKCIQIIRSTFLLFLALSVTIQAKDSYELSKFYSDSYAVLIGINKYNKMTDLEYAESDTKEMQALLINKFGFNKDNITIVAGEDATRDNIKNSLYKTLTQEAGSNDRVLVFFAGHGVQQETKSGGQIGYILPFDGDPESPYTTAYAMTELKQLTQISDAKHILFLVDACYGGLAAEGTRGGLDVSTPGYLDKITRDNARHIITAGGAGEEVSEKFEWGSSAFMKSLKSGLGKELADQDNNGYITSNELGEYLKVNVSDDSEGKQTPVSKTLSTDSGEFIFFCSIESTEPEKLKEEIILDKSIPVETSSNIEVSNQEIIDFLTNYGNEKILEKDTGQNFTGQYINDNFLENNKSYFAFAYGDSTIVSDLYKNESTKPVVTLTYEDGQVVSKKEQGQDAISGGISIKKSSVDKKRKKFDTHIGNGWNPNWKSVRKNLDIALRIPIPSPYFHIADGWGIAYSPEWKTLKPDPMKLESYFYIGHLNKKLRYWAGFQKYFWGKNQTSISARYYHDDIYAPNQWQLMQNINFLNNLIGGSHYIDELQRTGYKITFNHSLSNLSGFKLHYGLMEHTNLDNIHEFLKIDWLGLSSERVSYRDNFSSIGYDTIMRNDGGYSGIDEGSYGTIHIEYYWSNQDKNLLNPFENAVFWEVNNKPAILSDTESAGIDINDAYSVFLVPESPNFSSYEKIIMDKTPCDTTVSTEEQTSIEGTAKLISSLLDEGGECKTQFKLSKKNQRDFTPGRYHYRYMVNDTLIIDPDNENTAYNNQNEQVSVTEIKPFYQIYCDFEYSDTYIGSDVNYKKYHITLLHWRPISFRESLTMKLTMGYGTQNLPIQEKFFLDSGFGLNTFRGLGTYKQFIGNHLFAFNMDYNFLLSHVKFTSKQDVPMIGHLSLDISNSSDSFEQFKNLNASIGIGISLNRIVGLQIFKTLDHWQNNHLTGLFEDGDTFFNESHSGGIHINFYFTELHFLFIKHEDH